MISTETKKKQQPVKQATESETSLAALTAAQKRVVRALHNRLRMQLSLVEKVIETPDESLLKKESDNMDRIFQDHNDANIKYLNFGGATSFDIDIESIEVAVFSLKGKRYTAG